MKPEKHVAIAKKTIEYWQDTHAFKIPADIKHDMLLDFSEALSQVESEALASKVVLPAKFYLSYQSVVIDKGDYDYDDITDAIKRLNPGAAFKIEGE